MNDFCTNSSRSPLSCTRTNILNRIWMKGNEGEEKRVGDDSGNFLGQFFSDSTIHIHLNFFVIKKYDFIREFPNQFCVESAVFFSFKNHKIFLKIHKKLPDDFALFWRPKVAVFNSILKMFPFFTQVIRVSLCANCKFQYVQFHFRFSII